jgi:hypothetical protein
MSTRAEVAFLAVLPAGRENAVTARDGSLIQFSKRSC